MDANKRTLYEIIGVPQFANREIIEEACLRLAEEYRPDSNPNDSFGAFTFQEIENAYATLTDPAKRAAYDAMLLDGQLADQATRMPYVSPIIPSKDGWLAPSKLKWLGIISLALIAVFWLGNLYLASAARQELEARGIPFTPDRFTKEASEHADIVKLFLRAGMSPDVKDRRGNTPLYAAVVFLNLESIRLLVNAGANINAQSPDDTPLSAALATVRRETLLRIYIAQAAGGDLAEKWREQRTILKEHNLGLAVPVVEYLLDHGADPSVDVVRAQMVRVGKDAGTEELDTGTEAVFQVVATALEKRGRLVASANQSSPIAQIPSREIKGTGQQASELIPLKKGLLIFRLRHAGNDNFSIFLVDSNGKKLELLVNTIGSFEGSKAVRIPADGFYLLDVSADGQWSVHIGPP